MPILGKKSQFELCKLNHVTGEGIYLPEILKGDPAQRGGAFAN
jgi:hypothetical protein